MPAQRLVVRRSRPGPAVGLAAGALVAALGRERAVRPVTIGLDLPLWRLLYDGDSRPPRTLDPVLHPWPLAAELQDWWAEDVDLVLFVAVEPALDRWHGVEGSRAVDLAVRFDAPLVLVVDARDRGPTVAAAVIGVRALARRTELAGVIRGRRRRPGLRRRARRPAARRDRATAAGLDPSQLSEQFAREQAAPPGVRQLGSRPASGGAQALCPARRRPTSRSRRSWRRRAARATCPAQSAGRWSPRRSPPVSHWPSAGVPRCSRSLSRTSTPCRPPASPWPRCT